MKTHNKFEVGDEVEILDEYGTFGEITEITPEGVILKDAMGKRIEGVFPIDKVIAI